MNKLASEKYNILLIILIFVIPLFAIDFGFYYISKINFRLAQKEQEKDAYNEAETLADEGKFNTEFAMHFVEFINEINNIAKVDNANDSFVFNHLKQSAKKIFEKPFPTYNIYVFRIPNDTKQAKLIYNEGTLSSGKRPICKAFEYLYETNIEINNTYNESFAKKLLGEYTNTKSIAKEMRGITTNIKRSNKNSWFIWDYIDVDNKGIYGVFLISDEIYNHANLGRLLALKRLKKRGKAVGAFIPVYKEYGEPIYQSPLDKSNKFINWTNSLTIKNTDEINHWVMNSLPQKHEIGNYSAFCHLDRSSSHIAVILVKSIKRIKIPKWLIFINLFFTFTLLIILYCGISFGIWPQLKLKTRFIISYALASVVPLSLLSVVAYGYLLEYENTSEELANNELLLSLKDFDSYKLSNIREYKTTFKKAIKDPNIIKLIKEHGINSKLVSDYVVNLFEKEGDPKNSLPIIGAKIFNEVGEGAISNGSLSSLKEIKNLFGSFSSVYVDILRDEIEKENPGIKLSEYKPENDSDITNKAYNMLTGRELKSDLKRHFSVPLPRKNNDMGGYMIFDTIKIDSKTKYILLVLWDDKTLEERIINNAFNNYSLKNKHQNFLAYKIKGQKLDYIGKKTRHATENFLKKITEVAKRSSNLKKTETYKFNKLNKDTYEFKDKIIVVMPALNFNQTIFVGWVDKIEIILDLLFRKLALILLILISLTTLWICSLRSSSVFLKPITSLKNALDEVSYGNLNIDFKNNPNNELGKLSNEFSKMIAELREKERLSKLISDQAVQALKKNSSTVLNDTETFKGVALVSDIRNFTGMSENYDPTIITELLNEHFAEMAKIISENGGLIYKFIGDAIEAVFPEKEELEQSAIERAFKAGCQMLIKLKAINNRREKLDLFNYKIGVGLCYGTMYSGTVGSLETRLDYSILGDPLKKAAKLEALTIQNPDFPLTLDETIAEKMANLGLAFKMLDSKGENYNVYTLNKNEIKPKSNSFLSSITENKENINKKDNEISNENIKFFSLSTNSAEFKLVKNLLFYSFIIISISTLITFYLKIFYNTTYKHLKLESDKYATRLIEQLKCDDINKSAFETLCLEFYDDIKKINLDDKTQTLKQKIEQIALKYEKLGIPIPKYCCCFLDDNTIPKSEKILNKNFTEKTSLLFYEYANNYKKSIINNLKSDIVKKPLNELLGYDSNNFLNMRQNYYRRSTSTTIEGQKTLFDTDKFYDKNHNELIAYIFCGFPDEKEIELSPNYYTLLARKELLLAIKDKNNWYFSQDFPESEKKLFLNNFNNTSINKKDYFEKTININNKPFKVYIISRDLLSNYYIYNKLIAFSFILSVLLLSLTFWLLEKNIIINLNSISSTLRKDIFLSAILPLLTVSVVSYLFVEEESNINKSELVLKLNQQINEIENREYYYSPLLEHFLRNLPKSQEIHNSLEKIIKSKDVERSKECDNLSNYLKVNLIGRKYKKHFLNLKQSDTYIDIKEIIFVGKDGWLASAIPGNEDRRTSPFGDFISIVVKNIYLKKNNSNNVDENGEALKNELISDKFLEALSSAYGSDVSLRLCYLPDNLIIVSNSFSSIGLYIGCFPNINNPEYALVSLLYFDNEYKPDICNNKNDRNISLKKHFASNSMDDKIFCFYSTNIEVGDHFFLDNWDNNKREESQTLKELNLAACWINSSYLPLSKKNNINGTHYLEARQGTFIKDNIYATIGSEYPILKSKSDDIKTYASILLFAIVLIFLIAQSIILDLLDPVKKLINGAIEVSKGNYKFRTDFSRNDELGALCFSFDKMMKGLEEKQLMNRMVSKTALRVNSNLSDTNSKKVDVVLLYVTVPNFDIIRKQTSPFELFSKLKKQIAIISELVINNGGDIDKIMGEKMLIAFHIGDKNPKDVAVLACKVAHEIENSSKIDFKISVGVNYGQVISGFLGVGEKRDFTIIGDPVNVAARIAVFAEKLESNRCVVSEAVMNLVSSKLKTEEYGEVLFKGKTQPAKVYRIL